MRRLMPTLAIFCAVTLTGAAQQPQLRFEVASIKLWSPPTTPGVVVRAPAGSGIFNRATPVAGLITSAYEVEAFQLSVGDDWVRTERYDVAARAGREASWDEVREMIKTLLSERFKLRIRAETREMPILELRVARSDGRVGRNLHDCSDPNDKEGISPEKGFRAPTNGGVATADCADGLGALASIATGRLQTMVVDKTGLMGQWRFDFYFTSDDLAARSNPDLPSFEGAIREQLGLRLERTRGPAPVIVIQSVERPTPN